MRSDSRKIVLGVLAGLVCAGIIAFGFIKLIGDTNPKPVNRNVQTSAEDQDDFSLENIWEYRTAYMGEAPKVSQLFSHLPLNFYKKEIELVSTEFRTEVFYKGTLEELGEERVRKAVLYNSISAFALISNLQEVDYHLDGQVYMVKRYTLIDFCQQEGIVWDSIAYQPVWANEGIVEETLTEEKKILWKQMASRLDEADLQQKIWNGSVLVTTEEGFEKVIEEGKAKEENDNAAIKNNLYDPGITDGTNFIG